MKKYLPILEKCTLFDGIAPENLSAVLGCLGARVVLREKHEAIFMEGDPARQVGVVLSGSAQVIREDFYGNRSILASVLPGQLFGEAFACADVQRMPVSVVSMEKNEIMLIDCRKITMTCSSACSFHNRLILNLLNVMAEKNLMLSRKLEILSGRTIRDKLMTYLLEQAKRFGSAEFTIPFDRQALADYLGVERSALSAEISKLRAEGVFENRKSAFRLL